MEQHDALQAVLARLQQSLSSAPPGTVGFLRLTPGVYQGPIRLTFPITILGEPGTEIVSDHDAVATVSLSNSEYPEGIVTLRGVTLRRNRPLFELQKSYDRTALYVFSSTTHQVRLEQCTLISECGPAAVVYAPFDAIETQFQAEGMGRWAAEALLAGANLTLHDCNLVSAEAEGIKLHHSRAQSATLTHCRIRAGGQRRGIDVVSEFGPVTISDTEIHSGGEGISAYRGAVCVQGGQIFAPVPVRDSFKAVTQTDTGFPVSPEPEARME
jgi:hypothetical protein